MERFETKYDLLNKAYQDIRLKRTTKAIMQYLVMKSDEKGCHPSVATIAEAIGRSERTVQRHMRILEHAGYISNSSRFYQQNQLTNQYSFQLDVMDEEHRDIVPIGAGMKEEIAAEREQSMEFDQNGAGCVPSMSCEDQTGITKSKYIQSIYQSQLSAGERMLLIYMIHKANQGGLVYGRIDRICRELHMSRRLLYRTIRRLRQMGAILVKSRHGDILVKLQNMGDSTSNVSENHHESRERKLYPESKNIYQINILKNDPLNKLYQENRKEKVRGSSPHKLLKVLEQVGKLLQYGYHYIQKIIRKLLL